MKRIPPGLGVRKPKRDTQRWDYQRIERILAGMCATPRCPRMGAVQPRHGSKGPNRERSRCARCLALARKATLAYQSKKGIY
jgi:hypothetical protein